MDVYEAASTNVAVREFQPGFISDDELTIIFEAARLTQSAKNLQPWYFIVIRDRVTLDKLAALMQGDVDEGLLRRSPMAVGIVGDPKSEFWLFDLGRVVQTMTLVAWELGIGSCIVSGPEPPDREKYRADAGKILGVADGLRLQELLALGYPKDKKRLGRKNRRKRVEIVFSERFGLPVKGGG